MYYILDDIYLLYIVLHIIYYIIRYISCMLYMCVCVCSVAFDCDPIDYIAG